MGVGNDKWMRVHHQNRDSEELNGPHDVSGHARPLPGKTMRKDGYEVLGRREKHSFPGDIELNDGDRDDHFMGPMNMED